MQIRKHWPLLVCGVVLLLTVLTHQAGVPLYDGVDFPDEPYRYVIAPKGKETANKPLSATASGLADNGTNTDGIYVSTSEQGPQIYASFTQRSFKVPVQAGLVRTEVRPLAPDGGTPTSGTVVGNVYRLGATSDGGAVSYIDQPTAPSYVDMRLPQGYPVGATMVYRATPTAAWQSLPTTKVGSDIYEAKLVGLGDYALTSRAALRLDKKENIWPIIALGLAALVTAGLVGWQFVLRKRRGKAI